MTRRDFITKLSAAVGLMAVAPSAVRWAMVAPEAPMEPLDFTLLSGELIDFHREIILSGGLSFVTGVPLIRSEMLREV